MVPARFTPMQIAARFYHLMLRPSGPPVRHLTSHFELDRHGEEIARRAPPSLSKNISVDGGCSDWSTFFFMPRHSMTRRTPGLRAHNARLRY